MVKNFKQFTAIQYKDVMSTFVAVRKDKEETAQGVADLLPFDKARKRFIVNY